MHKKLIGIVGLFKNPDALVQGAKEVRSRGFIHSDAYTPFPIHGMDKLLGQKRSLLPWITLVMGLAGCFGGLALTIWTSAIDWPLNVGGKPLVSLPAFVPIIFECTILLGGIFTVVGLFGLCRLPNYHTHVFDKDITHDVYALFIPAKEKGFQESDVKGFLEKSGAYEIKTVE